MNTLKNKLALLLLVGFVSTMFTGCVEEEDYEVRLRNSMHIEGLGGLVPSKNDVTAFKINGETVVGSLPYDAANPFSEYFTVTSGEEYSLSVEYTQYNFNLNDNVWNVGGSFTEDLGVYEWSTDECNPQRIVLETKTFLGVPTGVEYTVYCD